MDSVLTTNSVRGALLARDEAQGASRLLRAYAALGIFFMLFPGTLVGVLNLVAISGEHSASAIAPAWAQAHGHAQIFGWIGTLIIGIGYYSLPRSRRSAILGVDEGWIALALWGAGALLRWSIGMSEPGWRWKLPVSAVLELAGFLLFFRASAGHRPPPGKHAALGAWALVVVGATAGLLAVLIANLGLAMWLSVAGESPAISRNIDERYLASVLWAFLVPMVWGFTARWSRPFLGVSKPRTAALLVSYLASLAGVVAHALGWHVEGSLLVLAASGGVAVALSIFATARYPVRMKGAHPWIPAFIRLAYAWLIVGAGIGLWGAAAGGAAGINGASRHALTVGFLATMVLSVGPRILPVFAGKTSVFSPALVAVSLVALNAGCAIRVTAQILAYQHYAESAWSWLPVSAVIELSALTAFAANMALTQLASRPHSRAALPRQAQ